MHWFIFQQLHFLSYQNALQQIQIRHFFDHQLTGLFQQVFDSRLYKVKKWIVKQCESTHGWSTNIETTK